MSDILYDRDPIKFAYWVPNVSGGLVISDIEQRTDWSIDYNRKLAQIAERSGFDYALSQIRFTAGYGAEYQHESVSFSHALLAATTTLKVIAAILPGPWNLRSPPNRSRRSTISPAAASPSTSSPVGSAASSSPLANHGSTTTSAIAGQRSSSERYGAFGPRTTSICAATSIALRL